MCKSLRFLGQQAVLHRLEAFFYILEAGMRAERKKEGKVPHWLDNHWWSTSQLSFVHECATASNSKP
ncbi:unnamed protein product [Prunus armeniaca]